MKERVVVDVTMCLVLYLGVVMLCAKIENGATGTGTQTASGYLKNHSVVFRPLDFRFVHFLLQWQCHCSTRTSNQLFVGLIIYHELP